MDLLISVNQAKLLAACVLEDIKKYIEANPEEYAQFLEEHATKNTIIQTQ